MTESTTFPSGVFTPDPRPAPVASMLAAQTSMELRLLLRNGEQLLLTMFIPVTLLVGLCLVPFSTDAGDSAADRATTFLPVILAIAIMSTAFTGQAIAVGFDRRYGALKRLGATALPRWGLITGKSLAVLIVVIGQMVLLSAIATAFGWRPNPAGIGFAILAIVGGTVAFAALGLALGGTGKAEVVLALANLIWFVLAAFASLVVVGSWVPDGLRAIAELTPSGALANALRAAGEGHAALASLLVLLAWAVIGSVVAVRWFRFD